MSLRYAKSLSEEYFSAANIRLAESKLLYQAWSDVLKYSKRSYD